MQASKAATPKILIVTTVASTIDAFLLPFAEHLRDAGWRVEAAARAGSEQSWSRRMLECVHQVHDVPWSRNPLALLSNVSGFSRMRQILSAGQYDIVHTHTPIASFITRIANRSAKRQSKLVYTAHGFHFDDQRRGVNDYFYWFAEWLTADLADVIVAINRQDYDSRWSRRLSRRERLNYIPGIGIDLNEFKPEADPVATRASVLKELGIRESSFVILMAAEFIPRKRHLDVVKAATMLRDYDVCFVLAGEGKRLRDIERIACRLDLQDRLKILGFRSDIRGLLAASNALVLPSEQEGLPRSILEAMAMGVPVIASRVRGSEELLGSGAGLLFETGDVKALASAISKLIEEPAVRERCRLAAFQLVKDYRLEVVLARYMALYNGLLAKG